MKYKTQWKQQLLYNISYSILTCLIFKKDFICNMLWQMPVILAYLKNINICLPGSKTNAKVKTYVMVECCRCGGRWREASRMMLGHPGNAPKLALNILQECMCIWIAYVSDITPASNQKQSSIRYANEFSGWSWCMEWCQSSIFLHQ